MKSDQQLPPSFAPNWCLTNPCCWTISTKRNPKTGAVYQLVGVIDEAAKQVCFPSCRTQGGGEPSQQTNSLWGYAGTVKRLVKGASVKAWLEKLPREMTKVTIAKRLAEGAWEPVLSVYVVENATSALPEKQALDEAYVILSRADGRMLSLSKEAKALIYSKPSVVEQKQRQKAVAPFRRPTKNKPKCKQDKPKQDRANCKRPSRKGRPLSRLAIGAKTL